MRTICEGISHGIMMKKFLNFRLLFDESIEVVSPANEDTVIIDSVDQLALEFNEKVIIFVIEMFESFKLK